MAFFTQDQLEAIAGALGDTDAGLKGEETAQLIDHLKKPDMAKEAERLLADTGWLPEPLRIAAPDAGDEAETGESETLPAFLAAEEDAEDDGDPQPVAAE